MNLQHGGSQQISIPNNQIRRNSYTRLKVLAALIDIIEVVPH